MAVQRILIIEDEAIIAEEIASRLTVMGYQVAGIEACGEAAIVLAERSRPDLVLMDIQLQGPLDGIALAKQIYQSWAIPVVYLTAYGDEKTLQKAKFEGAFGYLLKPFKERDLRATLEIALSRHQTEARIHQSLPGVNTDNLDEKKQINDTKAYVSLVSHELRNPLSHIKLWSQLLQRNANTWSPTKKQEGLQHIQSSADQMEQLIDDMLALSQSSISPPVRGTEPLDLVSFCKKLLQAHQFTAGDRVRMNLSVEEFPLMVDIHESVLGYIFNNLLSNAIKYSLTGGEVRLELFRRDRQIGCRIRDGGIGIAEADFPLLFTPFYRGANVRSIPGTGLGLVIAKRCVDRCGGTLTLESELGLGTTATLMLPSASP